jgi:hypothetical protein
MVSRWAGSAGIRKSKGRNKEKGVTEIGPDKRRVCSDGNAVVSGAKVCGLLRALTPMAKPELCQNDSNCHRMISLCCRNATDFVEFIQFIIDRIA